MKRVEVLRNRSAVGRYPRSDAVYSAGKKTASARRIPTRRSRPPSRRSLRLFLAQVSARYSVRDTYLFDSRAKGDFRSDSDADRAILLRGQPGAFLDIKLELADIAYDVLLETGIRIQPLPIWEDEWTPPEAYSNPQRLLNIRREGIRLVADCKGGSVDRDHIAWVVTQATEYVETVQRAFPGEQS